jgi:hypothetical protein
LKIPKVKPLLESERNQYLAATPHLNHNAEDFQKWLTKKKLRRRAGEGDVEFARRVLGKMVETFTYKHPFNHDGKATTTCKTQVGDCGCMSSVFVSALRANGIPARELVGRYAESSKGDDYKTHARAEFYAEKVGWIPVDPTYALSDKAHLGLMHFGQDRGDLLIMHLDGSLIVDTRTFGKQTAVRLQGVAFWASGGGSFEGSRSSETWTVRKLPLPKAPTKSR